MKLTNIIQRLRNQAAENEEQRSAAAKENSGSEREASVTANSNSGVSLENALDEFRIIQELLRSSDESLTIPGEALLANLPENLRGDKYDPAHFPDISLHIDRIELLEQLERGKAVFPLHIFAEELPEGWVRLNGGDETVELSLADVVAAVPADLLQASATPSKAAQEVAFMQDYFTPKHGLSDKSKEKVVEKPVPEKVQPVRKRKPAPQQSYEPAISLPVWDGIERSLNSAPSGLDINSVALAKLEKLAGVGPVRARTIIEYRQSHGRFESVFDLGKVPGIGPAVFQQMTGLSLRTRRKRHEKLNQLLGAEWMDQLTLAEIAEGIMEKMNATGALITNNEGMCLTAIGEAGDDSKYYAAVGAQFVSRTSKYTERLTSGGAQCVVLPAGNPPLMVLAGGDVVIILTLKRRRSVSPQRLHKAIAVAQEVQWLMGPRAIVRSL